MKQTPIETIQAEREALLAERTELQRVLDEEATRNLQTALVQARATQTPKAQATLEEARSHIRNIKDMILEMGLLIESVEATHKEALAAADARELARLNSERKKLCERVLVESSKGENLIVDLQIWLHQFAVLCAPLGYPKLTEAHIIHFFRSQLRRREHGYKWAHSQYAGNSPPCFSEAVATEVEGLLQQPVVLPPKPQPKDPTFKPSATAAPGSPTTSAAPAPSANAPTVPATDPRHPGFERARAAKARMADMESKNVLD